MACCTRKCSAITLLVVGLLLILVGGVLIWGFKQVIRDQIKKEEVIENGGTVYDNWVTPPAPVTMQFYVFGVENHDEVMKNPANTTISLQQHGPYTYQEHREKVDIRFSPDGTQVSYREIRYFIFDEARSAKDINEKIWFPNLFLIGVTQLLQYEPTFLKQVADIAISLLGDGNLFIQHSVHDMIWGYEDPLLEKVHNLVPTFPDKVGLFYGQNNTDDGNYTIFTGKGDSNKFGVVHKWNGAENVSFWETKYGNMINGSDGTIFPPFVDEDRIPFFFSTDICRSIYATYDSKVTLKDIDLLHFTIPDVVLAGVDQNPANYAFCTPSGAKPDCLPGGTLNISICKQSQPIVVSLPHFYNGDKSLRHKFNGLNPNTEEHQTFLDIEPNTGAVMNVAKRLQINMYVKPIEGFNQFEGWSDLIFPLVWINESAALTDSLASDFKDQVLKPVLITQVVQYLMIAIGSVMVIIAIILFLMLCCGDPRKPMSLRDIVDEYSRMEDEREDDPPPGDTQDQ